MSAWGIGVWQDDMADDVVLMFNDLCEEGYDAREALRRVMADPPWGWGDVDGDAAQILALAALALQHGVLDPALRDRAITMIESGDPLGTWTQSDPQVVAAREQLLERFKALLQCGSATPEELKEVTAP
jgi:hypothetical protein